MSDQMISIIGKLIAAVFVGVVTYLVPKVKDRKNFTLVAEDEVTTNGYS